MPQCWPEITEQLNKRLSPSSFSLWIKPIRLLEETPDRLVLGFRNRFSSDWVRQNYAGMILDIGRSVSGGSHEIEFRVDEGQEQKKPERPPDVPKQMIIPDLIRRNGRALYSFDNFITGDSNNFAFHAMLGITKGAGQGYGIVSILGDPGSGKTHLMQAAMAAMIAQDSAGNILYMTAEKFLNDMIRSIKSGSAESFRDSCRHCRALFLDDLHFLSGKIKTQDELSHTVEHLLNAGRLTIVSSSIPLNKIPKMSKELISRLQSGLMLSLERPDAATRLAIANAKAREAGFQLNQEALERLSGPLLDVRQIESAIKTLKAKGDLLGIEINLSAIDEVLEPLVDGSKYVSLNDIEVIISKYYKIENSQLRMKSRKSYLVKCRAVFCYLAREHTGKTLSEIGRRIDRSHSSVLYQIIKIENKIRVNDKIKREIDFLRSKVGGDLI